MCFPRRSRKRNRCRSRNLRAKPIRPSGKSRQSRAILRSRPRRAPPAPPDAPAPTARRRPLDAYVRDIGFALAKPVQDRCFPRLAVTDHPQTPLHLWAYPRLRTLSANLKPLVCFNRILTELAGLSANTAAAELNRRGIATPKGAREREPPSKTGTPAAVRASRSCGGRGIRRLA
jgi:hypothetical protein